MMRKQQPSKSKLPIKPSFLLGLMLGMLFMWIPKLLALARVSRGDQSVPPENRLPSAKGSPGWHQVNVFYGEKSGLKDDPKQEYFSQVHQDQIVLDLIGDKGYFIDLAANDAKEFSNTLLLERRGWDGLCIEPNPGYWYSLSHRKCVIVGALVGASKEQVKVTFRGVYGGIVGKMDNDLANRKKEPQAAEEDRFTVPLLEIFSKFKVPKSIDYFSLDVEGAEFIIMKDFPFDTYKIKIMTVERPSKELGALLEGNGFVFLKDLAWWGETLWAHRSMGLTPEHAKIAKIKTEEKQ